jgi:hypothetical protein
MCKAVKFQPKFWKIQSLAIFHLHSPSGRTVTLETTQSLIKNEYQDYFLGGKGGRRERQEILPPSYADCLEI